jgi:hypothetical protein
MDIKLTQYLERNTSRKVGLLDIHGRITIIWRRNRMLSYAEWIKVDHNMNQRELWEHGDEASGNMEEGIS